MEAAHAAAKAKGTYLRDKFYRLKARRGLKRAAVAVAHKILVATVCYNELGDLYLDKLNKHLLTRNLVHRLERLGYNVSLGPPVRTFSARGFVRRPSFSPDGKKVAFESDRLGYSDIWVCESDGSNCSQLTSLHTISGTARWSPDGHLHCL